MILFFLFLASTISGSVEHFYKNDPNVKEVTSVEDFIKLYRGPFVTVVEFYAHWCGHCQKFVPQLSKAADNLKNIINFAAINCDTEELKPICGQFKVEGLPTVLLFKSDYEKITNPETKEEGYGKNPIKYVGPHTAAGVANWALQHMTDVVARVNPENFDKFIAAPGDAKFIFFGKKEAPSNLIKNIALSVKIDNPEVERRAIVGYSTSEKLAKNLKVSREFPALIVINNGNVVVYDGKMAYPEMKEFIFSHANTEIKEMKENQQQQTPKPSKSQPKTPELHALRTSSDWENACANSPRGLCLITFLDESDQESHLEYIATLETIVPKVPHIHVMWVDSPNFPKFSNSFNIAQGYPQVVIYQRGSSRMKNFMGGFEESQLMEFIDSATKGKRIITIQQPVFDEPKNTDL